MDLKTAAANTNEVVPEKLHRQKSVTWTYKEKKFFKKNIHWALVEFKDCQYLKQAIAWNQII